MKVLQKAMDLSTGKGTSELKSMLIEKKLNGAQSVLKVVVTKVEEGELVDASVQPRVEDTEKESSSRVLLLRRNNKK